jgi:hypothetical protein
VAAAPAFGRLCFAAVVGTLRLALLRSAQLYGGRPMTITTPHTPRSHLLPAQADRSATRMRRIRWLIGIMIGGLTLSGLTAIPLVWEVSLLMQLFGPGTAPARLWPELAAWIATVHTALTVVDQQYPLLMYGTDWLAFAHIILAILFVGPWRDPIRNLWVVEFGLIACVLIIPTALGFGELRGIPLFWRLIDCSFGVGGFIPLWLVRREILMLQNHAGPQSA